MTQSYNPLLRFSALLASAAFACSSPQQLGEKQEEAAANRAGATSNVFTWTSSVGATNSVGSANLETKAGGGGNSTTSALLPSAGGTAIAFDSAPVTVGSGSSFQGGAGGGPGNGAGTHNAGGAAPRTSEAIPVAGGFGGNAWGGAGPRNAGGTVSRTIETLPPATGAGGNVQGGAGSDNAGGMTSRTSETTATAGRGGGNVQGGLGGFGVQSTEFGGAPSTDPLDEVCTLPSVNFEFTVEEPSLYCWNQKSDYWRGFVDIEIFTEQGAFFTFLHPYEPAVDRFHRPSCPVCGPQTADAVAPVQSDMTARPTTGTWNGDSEEMHFCANQTWCGIRRCAPAGRYIAKFCVAPKGSLSSCASNDPSKFLTKTKCVEVPFDFPTSELVTGRIISGAQ